MPPLRRWWRRATPLFRWAAWEPHGTLLTRQCSLLPTRRSSLPECACRWMAGRAAPSQNFADGISSMAFATTSDGVQLFYESAGKGTPIVFVHEFGGNHWSWEPQVSYFSRRHECITFSARGYPPSDIPGDVENYSQSRAADDIIGVMDAVGIDTAHVVGLSMGAFASLHAALRYPGRIRSAVIAGAGYGSER